MEEGKLVGRLLVGDSDMDRAVVTQVDRRDRFK